eukprot:jgi/Ulvmu1/2345/UM013_0193.1
MLALVELQQLHAGTGETGIKAMPRSAAGTTPSPRPSHRASACICAALATLCLLPAAHAQAPAPIQTRCLMAAQAQLEAEAALDPEAFTDDCLTAANGTVCAAPAFAGTCAAQSFGRCTGLEKPIAVDETCAVAGDSEACCVVFQRRVCVNTTVGVLCNRLEDDFCRDSCPGSTLGLAQGGAGGPPVEDAFPVAETVPPPDPAPPEPVQRTDPTFVLCIPPPREERAVAPPPSQGSASGRRLQNLLTPSTLPADLPASSVVPPFFRCAKVCSISFSELGEILKDFQLSEASSSPVPTVPSPADGTNATAAPRASPAPAPTEALNATACPEDLDFDRVLGCPGNDSIVVLGDANVTSRGAGTVMLGNASSCGEEDEEGAGDVLGTLVTCIGNESLVVLGNVSTCGRGGTTFLNMFAASSTSNVTNASVAAGTVVACGSRGAAAVRPEDGSCSAEDVQPLLEDDTLVESIVLMLSAAADGRGAIIFAVFVAMACMVMLGM